MNQEQIDKLWELIKSTGIAMMTTEDGDHLRARPMAASQKTFDGTLWFFTHAKAHKVDEVKGDERVCVTYADPKLQNYVSLSGHASLTQDRALIDEHWHEMLLTWFPKGKDDPGTALLKVEVTQAEYWDAPNQTMLHAYGYLKAKLTGKMPSAGENEKIS